jgi:hypothetical protein
LIVVDLIPPPHTKKKEKKRNKGKEIPEFSSFSEAQFWLRRLLNNTALVKTVFEILLPFPTTYVCEARFSTLLQIKTKYGRGGGELKQEDDLRCGLSPTLR